MVALLSFLLRLIVAAVFIYAGLEKIADPWMFGKQVHAYQMLPDEYISAVAIYLPWLELIAGFGMILGAFYVRSAGSVICMLLLLLFIGVQGYALVNGMVIECGCFGGSKAVSWPGVITNAAWLLIAFGGLLLDRKPDA